MEATGTYNLAVTYYLHEQGGEVAVLNPLVIKHFIQMHLSKGRSDRKVVLSLSWLFLLSYPFCVSPICYSPQDVSSLHKGQSVTIKGLCKGLMGDVLLDEFELLPNLAGEAKEVAQRVALAAPSQYPPGTHPPAPTTAAWPARTAGAAARPAGQAAVAGRTPPHHNHLHQPERVG